MRDEPRGAQNAVGVLSTPGLKSVAPSVQTTAIFVRIASQWLIAHALGHYRMGQRVLSACCRGTIPGPGSDHSLQVGGNTFVDTPVSRRRNPSSAMIVTFVLGLFIGLSIGFAIWGSGQAPIQTASVPDAPAPTKAESTEPKPAPDPEPEPVAEVTPVATEAPKEETTPVEPAPVVPAETTTPAPTNTVTKHLFIAIPGKTLDGATKALLAEVKPGGVVLLADNVADEAQTKALVEAIKAATDLGSGMADLPLIAVDQEGGSVNRLLLDKAPSHAELGKGRDAAAARATGGAFAKACKDRGISVLLGPVLDVYEPGAFVGMAERSFGDNGPLVAAMGLAFSAGVMDNGVIPVVKHFPGLGAAKEDTHAELAVVDKPARDLAAVVYPFNAAVRGVPGMMAGHVALPQLDGKDGIRPASMSPVLLQDVLRTRWGYTGVVMSDDINMKAILSTLTPEEAAVRALQAGCDIVVFLDPAPDKIRAVVAAVQSAADTGAIAAEQLAASSARIDGWQAWLREPKPFDAPLPAVPTTRVATATEPAPAEVKPEEATAEVAAPATEEAKAAPTEPEPESAPVTPPANSKLVKHTIAKGETLAVIAKQYNVKQDELIAWNKLSSPEIKYGYKLDVYVPDATAPPAPEPAAPTPVDEQKSAEPAPTEAAPAPAPAADATRPETHTIVAGDTLTKLSKQYGVTVAQLTEWNKIENGVIKTGFKLRLTAPELPETPPAPEAPAETAPAPAPAPAAEPAAPAEPAASAPTLPAQPPSTDKREHTVSAGQSLEAVADQYGVDVADLRTWNALSSDELKEGQNLVIYLPVAAE